MTENEMIVSAKNQDPQAVRDKILACLYGGALGDALGYIIEFDSWYRIRKIYGEDGIRASGLRSYLPGADSSNLEGYYHSIPARGSHLRAAHRQGQHGKKCHFRFHFFLRHCTLFPYVRTDFVI